MTALNAFPCPSCGGSLAMVTDSRPVESFQGMRAIRRRRKCSACGEQHTTIEIPEEAFVGTKRTIAKNIATEILGKYL